jgi:hypothetical protein
MKRRKSFTQIGIDDRRFQYAITHGDPWGIVIYDENDQRYELKDLMSLGVPESETAGVWTGKHNDGAWGKRPVAWIIRNHIIKNNNK